MFWIYKHVMKYHTQHQNKTCLTCSKSSNSSQSICLISNLWGRVSDLSLCSDDTALEVSDPQVSLLQVTPSQSFALSATLSAAFKQFKLETYQEQKINQPLIQISHRQYHTHVTLIFTILSQVWVILVPNVHYSAMNTGLYYNQCQRQHPLYAKKERQQH